VRTIPARHERPTPPPRCSTLGILYLLARGRYADAQKVRAYIESTAFKLANRTIVKSSSIATYNQSYSATGYRPYASAGPDVLWYEGTAQVTWVTGLFGIDNSAWDKALASWRNVTISKGEGPLQADKTVTDNAINEYHVWPAAAAASRGIIALEGLPG